MSSDEGRTSGDPGRSGDRRGSGQQRPTGAQRKRAPGSGRRSDTSNRGPTGNRKPGRRDDKGRTRARGASERGGREDRSGGTYVPATTGRGSVQGPQVDEDAIIAELDSSVRRELSSLPGTLAEKVAGHLIMAGRLMDEDPELALQHASTAHDLAPRVLAVREALAIAAYSAADYKTAMREARTVRRMSGDDSWLPVIADCERGLGRPERALDMLRETDLAALPPEVRAEALMVMSGARRDLGQSEAAVALLDTDLLRTGERSGWAARLRVAYAEALAESGREEEAEKWRTLAAATDPRALGEPETSEIWDLLEQEPGTR